MSGEKVAASSGPSSGSVDVVKGINGLDKVLLRDPRGSSAEVYLYGAHVTSWKNDHGEEMLFVSSKAIFKPPKPIRGGIPICFPQFSNLGPLEAHGFARNKFWSIDNNPPPLQTNTSSKTFVDLILKPSEEDTRVWPHSYEYRLRVALGPAGELSLTSRVRNTNADGKPFSFTFAYHTYFSVSDISEVRVEGLETLDYLDNLQSRARFTEQGDALTFESEVDKIYLSTPSKIAILDHEKKRTFVVRKEGLPDAVVWNPCKAMADATPQVEEVPDKTETVQVTEASDDDDLPDLEAAPAGEKVGEGEAGSGKGKQSRTEKKSRKAVQRLGLKQVPGVIRIRVKKGRSVLFVVNTPDVYKNNSDSTYVIFGEAKIEQDAANSALSANLGGLNDEEVPDLVPENATPEPAAAAPSSDAGDSEGVNPEHIQLVIDQTSCTRAQAIAALKETNGDVVNAIMKITV